MILKVDWNPSRPDLEPTRETRWSGSRTFGCLKRAASGSFEASPGSPGYSTWPPAPCDAPGAEDPRCRRHGGMLPCGTPSSSAIPVSGILQNGSPYSASTCSRPETHVHLPEHCRHSCELWLRVLLSAVSSVECSKAEVAVGDNGSNAEFAASVSASQ